MYLLCFLVRRLRLLASCQIVMRFIPGTKPISVVVRLEPDQEKSVYDRVVFEVVEDWQGMKLIKNFSMSLQCMETAVWPDLTEQRVGGVMFEYSFGESLCCVLYIKIALTENLGVCRHMAGRGCINCMVVMIVIALYLNVVIAMLGRFVYRKYSWGWSVD